ncbi:LysR family transcriptional regulator [Kribbella speibonae]|uniref:LysR family transcriptional regulator n=1 Tax=Kribbella speibonae TaxID=1572660 RepID=A0A4R0II76_9ACTN|nr:LysR family transcriptional regulator [Kribbella speibonae]
MSGALIQGPPSARIKQPSQLFRQPPVVLSGPVNLDSLRAFVAVAEEGQFRYAADRLRLSQQAVSKRIAALESSLGVTLFDRVPTGATLTPQGRTFLPHAHAVLIAARHAVESVQDETRPLRVDILNSRTLPAVLMLDFHQTHPEIALKTLVLRGLGTALPALTAGEIDATFAYHPEPLPPGFESIVAYLEPHEIVVGDRHPLAGRTTVPLDELRRYTIWIPGIVDGSEWGAFYRELSAEFDLTIDSTGPNFGFEELVGTVAESKSLTTFWGERTREAGPWPPGLRRLRVVDPTPVYPWSLIWHSSNRHPDLNTLVEHVQKPPQPTDDLWLPRRLRTIGFRGD